MRRIATLAGLLLLAGALRAQGTPADLPQPDAPVRDVEFGVVTHAFGLERRVEMLQWQATPRGYQRVWSDEPIDASRADPAHANPVDWPLPGRRWLVRTATFDGKPLDPAVIDALGEWRDFRPSFNGLPGNMAVTFQPEGDGLGSADNPLAPEIGDLRIRWRELVLPSLQGQVRLVAGRWQLGPSDADGPDGVTSMPASAESVSPATPVPAPSARPATRWWLGGAALVVLLVAVAARRRRKS
jgi:hypothetical protein